MKMEELEEAAYNLHRLKQLQKELQAVKAYSVQSVKLGVASWVIDDDQVMNSVTRSLIAYYEAEISEIHLTFIKFGVTG